MLLTASHNLRRSAACLLLTMGGCQWFVDSADRQVYNLIEKRQLQALGETHDSRIDQEHVPVRPDDRAYEFVPRPVDLTQAELPSATRPADTRPATSAPADLTESGPSPLAPPTPPIEATARPMGGMGPGETALPTPPELQPLPEVTPPQELVATTQPALSFTDAAIATRPSRKTLTLSDSLAYAFQHSREFQFAKEDLYLSALALTLERHLWTPRFVSNIETQYANYGQIRDFDHAMSVVANVGVQQRLPLGGQVTAQVIDTLMRDLTHHITSAETGAMILQADIPLLRGAGLVAYESRFQAERDLIYAVRNFERFRRNLAVEIAGDFLNLQQLRQQIDNARESVKVFEQEVERARGLWRAGRRIQLEVQRADQDRLKGLTSLVAAEANYENTLDRFKIRIGMPTGEPIDVPYPPDPAGLQPGAASLEHVQTLEDALLPPAVSEDKAVELALRFRLDLLNTQDRIDDAARGVKIAENNLLPDLDATGSVRMDADPNRLGTWKYNTERTTWRAGLNLGLPLDRVAERNALRSSLIQKRRAERTYEENRDQVRLQVRRALREVEQAQATLEIQIINRNLAIRRRQGARIQFDKGIVSNREIVDAENELLDARNQLARAQSALRLAILAFRRDTETLRIDDSGQWALTNSGTPPADLSAPAGQGG